MLDSIDIKNYRNLKELRLSSLRRINLITGKNNTGKSTLLEAIAIYASKGSLPLIQQLLGDRGENFRPLENKNFVDLNIKALSSLFTNRIFSFKKTDSISIGSIENTLFGSEEIYADSVGIRFVRYFDKVTQVPDKANLNTFIRSERTIAEDIAESQAGEYKIGLEMRSGSSSYILSLDEDRPFRFGYKVLENNERLEYIRTRNIDKDINGRLWDNIILTEKEAYVIEALKIIEPNTERIAFIEENQKERTAVIKLTNSNSVVPLKSMGDGINRILTIILALVNADGGFLLIDEFENGLHHTVQEKLWNIIFNLSKRLKIQVFATTHSEDCISGFENVLNDDNNSLEGKLIRLDNEKGTIRQVEFNAKELKIASDNDIEIR